MGTMRALGRFAFKGRGLEGIASLGNVRELAFFAVLDREPEDVHLSDVRGPLVFRLREDREKEGTDALDDGRIVAFRFAIGR